MSDWVKFHAEILQGAKRGLPRATRFIFMELSLLSRRRQGVIELPVGMGDVAAVSDLLAGDQREIRAAIAQLSSGPEPMIRLEGEEGARRLVVTKWSKWNSVESSGASTDRVRKHRETVKRSLHPVSSHDETKGNGRETLLDQSREEKSRSSTGNATPPSQPERAPEPGGGAAAAGSAEEMRQAVREGLEAAPILAFAAHEASVEGFATQAVQAGKRVEWVRDGLRDLALKATAGGWSRERVEGGIVSVVKWAKAPPEGPGGGARASPFGRRGDLAIQPSGKDVKDWGYVKKAKDDDGN